MWPRTGNLRFRTPPDMLTAQCQVKAMSQACAPGEHRTAAWLPQQEGTN